MSVKRAFFGIFKKIMVICGIMIVPLFGGVAHSAGVVFKRFTILCSVLLMIFATPAHADDACKNLFDPVTLLSNGFTETNDGYYIAVPHFPGYILWENTSGYTGRLTLRYKLKYAASGQGFRFRIMYTDGTIDSLYTATATDWRTFSHVSADGKIVASIQGDYGSSIATYVKDIQLEEGTTATSYVPYNPLCATCDGTIENYTTVTENDVPAGVQNGTPTPTNPIEPVFYKQGNMILRKVGDIADSYDATTGKITRRVGVKVFNGTENWSPHGTITGWFQLGGIEFPADPTTPILSTHYKHISSNPSGMADQDILVGGTGANASHRVVVRDATRYPDKTSVQDFKTWMTNQYQLGTAFTLYYPLATETTENWNETTYCAPNIKIATTAYNAARFSPVQTDLNNAVATIREIITKTINQTAAIASLQADKQTRPEDACPAGKKCLLVETEENGVIVPHWFPIIEAPTD